MRQIKDGGPEQTSIHSLLAQRARLLERLAAVDAELLRKRAAAVSGEAAGPHSETNEDEGRFPLRGEDVRSRRWLGCPQGVDRDDLERRLEKILIDERRRGRVIDGLELLVRYQRRSGRVLAIDTRRSGDRAWSPRFEATTAGSAPLQVAPENGVRNESPRARPEPAPR